MKPWPRLLRLFFARLLRDGLLGSLFLAVCLLAAGCQSPTAQRLPVSQCRRIASFSPSVTEMLYALDLGPQVAGVTRYCRFPPEARRKPKIGGYVDPDVESLLRLRPDLVILRQEQTQLTRQLEGFGLPVLAVDHRTTDGILASFGQIGQVCHREAAAKAYVTHLRAEIQAVREKVAHATTRPRVLLVIDRDIQAQNIRWVYVAGQDGFYDRLITMAGGQNVVPAARKGFIQVSTEGILRMDPEVIIETLPSLGDGSARKASALRQWQTLPQLSAVKNHRLYLLSDEWMVIPGPRFTHILRAFAEAIHPEAQAVPQARSGHAA